MSALSRWTLGVGAAGVVVVLAAGLGGGLMSAAAGAAVGAGGGATSGPAAVRTSTVAVASLAASDPVPGAVQGVDGTGTGPVVPATLAPAQLQGIVAAPATTVVVARITTPAPTPAPPPAPGSVEAVITEVFGVHARAAIGVARCESHLNPSAVSRGGGNWGLFQINTAHRGRVQQMGYRWDDLLDPRVNALVAKSIFDEQGWRPWGCRRAAG